jgi:hypothetical protein
MSVNVVIMLCSASITTTSRALIHCTITHEQDTSWGITNVTYKITEEKRVRYYCNKSHEVLRAQPLQEVTVCVMLIAAMLYCLCVTRMTTHNRGNRRYMSIVVSGFTLMSRSMFCLCRIMPLIISRSIPSITHNCVITHLSIAFNSESFQDSISLY